MPQHNMSLEELQNFLREKSATLGFSHFGLNSLSRPLSFEFYENWLAEGLHGKMDYLQTHAPVKENPQRKWPQARSALIFAVPYYPHPEPPQQAFLKQARVSLYSQGYDYHHWFKGRLESLCVELREFFPSEEFIPLTDSSPVLERDLAYRAGLGWVGKNTCLINPKTGSLFFIGEIYSSLALTVETQLTHDFCGNCTRCIDICPTQALTEARKLDARKCISYLTIESRELPPVDLRQAIGDWFFGCDLCQTICPWNQKAFKNQLSFAPLESKTAEEEQTLEQELRWILEASGKKIEKKFFGMALSRAGSFGLKRNALIVAANRGLAGLTPEIQALTNHPKLGELALWALTRLAK